jgi:hypothetical protein
MLGSRSQSSFIVALYLLVIAISIAILCFSEG